MFIAVSAGLWLKVTTAVSGNVLQTGAVVQARDPAPVTGIVRLEDITSSAALTVGTDTSTHSVNNSDLVDSL